jgi:hypothetical protein
MERRKKIKRKITATKKNKKKQIKRKRKEDKRKKIEDRKEEKKRKLNNNNQTINRCIFLSYPFLANRMYRLRVQINQAVFLKHLLW